MSAFSLLKSVASGTDTEDSQSSLCLHHKALMKSILVCSGQWESLVCVKYTSNYNIQTDIKCESCDHSALQALGYFIHNVECAK